MTRFNTLYPTGTIPVFSEKKKEHVIEILFALGNLGSSTIHDLAKFVISTKSTSEHTKPKRNEIRKRGGIYYKLIKGRKEKRKGKLRKTKKYSGLISDGYVIQTGSIINTKGNEIPVYFLTLKGCFTVLGFSNLDIEKFIQNAALNHLYFKYIDVLLKKTNIHFVKYMFTNPVRDYISKGRINLKNEDISFYFTIIVESTVNAFRPICRSAFYQFYWNNPDSLSTRLYPILREIEIMMDNNYHYERPPQDWTDSIIEKWYSNSKTRSFFGDYSDYYLAWSLDSDLLKRLMTQIHFSYYLSDEYNHDPIPRLPRNKFGRSRSLRRHQYYKKHFTSWKSKKKSP